MATGAIVASAIIGAGSAGYSAYQSHEQKLDARSQARKQNREIEKQKQVELNKRKQLIDEQRYNLFGNNTQGSNNTNTVMSNTTSYNLLDNNKTLG